MNRSLLEEALFYLPIASVLFEQGCETFAFPPNARTRLLCRANCAEAVKWIQRISRLKDFAKSTQILRVAFSALVLSVISFHIRWWSNR